MTNVSSRAVAPEVELLLCLLHSSQSEANAARVHALCRANIDWSLFCRLSVYHGVCPYVIEQFDTVYDQIVDEASIYLLREESKVVRAKSMMLLAELSRLQRAFRNSDVPFLVLKGPVTALRYYGGFETRGFRDLDLFVRRKDIPAASRILADLSYKPQLSDELAQCLTSDKPELSSEILRDVLYEADFFGKNQMCIVDLHWRLLPNSFPSERLFDYQRQLAVGRHNIETVSPEVHFISICVHASKHRWSRLAWVQDLSRIMECPDSVNWQQVCDLSKKWGLGRTVRASLEVAHQVFGSPLPEHIELNGSLDSGVRAQVEEDMSDLISVAPIQRGIWNHLKREWALSDRSIQRMFKLLLDEVRPSQTAFTDVQLPPTFLPLIYVVAPPIVIGRRITRLLTNIGKLRDKKQRGHVSEKFN